MSDKKVLTHAGEDGRARMVDVGDKPETAREAIAESFVVCDRATIATLRAHRAPKGDVLEVARLAALQAAKRTPDLVPLCHPLRLSSVEAEVTLLDDRVRIWARVRAVERTGVEMEALTAALVGALTVYDMVKAIDRAATIVDARVLEKRGGKSGAWMRST